MSHFVEQLWQKPKQLFAEYSAFHYYRSIIKQCGVWRKIDLGGILALLLSDYVISSMLFTF